MWEQSVKIVMQRVSGGKTPLVAALDTNKYKSFASVNNIILRDKYSDFYEVILALLNSKLLNWFYAINFSNNSELTVNISKTLLSQLPIPDLNSINKIVLNKLKNIVSVMLNKQFKNSEVIKNKIDLIVYKLYNLTYEEVKIVDPGIGEIISEEEYEKFEIEN
ncbi:MAG: hypothetical protein SCALA702_06280 [Melioribacteraceae bacterium]|nr:MAG: hypothetical protein SCALA702_06280 [Melioribacteraceae bacterium]